MIGVPSRKYGEEVMAWVRLRPGAAVAEEELAALLPGSGWRRFKVPRYWQFVETISR